MEENDASAWESLHSVDSIAGVTGTESTTHTTTTSHASHAPFSAGPLCSSNANASSVYSRNDHDVPSHHEQMKVIQEKIDSRMRVKKELVDHPILLFWNSFLWNLWAELWNLDIRLRLSLFCAFFGAICSTILLSSTWMHCMGTLVRPLLGIILLLGPLLYLHPEFLTSAAQRFMDNVSSPRSIMSLVSRIDSLQNRRFLLCLLFLPTLLEMRTLCFLCHVLGDEPSTLCFTIAWTILVLVLQLSHSHGYSPRTCSYHGLVTLFGLAWLHTLLGIVRKWSTGNHLIWLSPPFLIGSSVLLYQSHKDDDEWMSRVVRHALRLTLRNVLESVSERVQSDELLQLALLRWIVDYWSTSQETKTPAAAAAAATSTSTTTTSTSRGSNLCLSSSPSLDSQLLWTDLLPMLTMATNQMENEVEILQHCPSNSIPVSTPLCAESKTQSCETQSSEMFSHVVNSSQLTERRSNSVVSYRTSYTEVPSLSFMNLQYMLLHMNLDKDARLAVDAWKRAVHSFPPGRHFAVIFATARRCPALLVVIGFVLGLFHSSSLCKTCMLLLPLAFCEICRTQDWCDACRKAYPSPVNDDEPTVSSLLHDMDPMFVILSSDSITADNPPSLLRVWYNVVSSTVALDHGLVTAKCVQTGVVAVDLAQHALCLVNLGAIVVQRGWWHGISMLVQEIIQWYAINAESHQKAQSSSSATGAARHGTPHVHAVITAARHSQTMSRNLSQIFGDTNKKPDRDILLTSAASILYVFTLILGRGWLWGQSDSTHVIHPQSTVTIEELDSETADATLLYTSHNSSDMKNECVGEIDKKSENESTVNSSSESSLPTATVSLSNLPSIDIHEVYDVKLLDQVRTIPERRAAIVHNDDDLKNPFDDRLSKALNLVAHCFQESIIVESEKHALCEKLARLLEGSKADEAWLAALSSSLQGLLLHSENRDDDQTPLFDHVNQLSIDLAPSECLHSSSVTASCTLDKAEPLKEPDWDDTPTILTAADEIVSSPALKSASDTVDNVVLEQPTHTFDEGDDDTSYETLAYNNGLPIENREFLPSVGDDDDPCSVSLFGLSDGVSVVKQKQNGDTSSHPANFLLQVGSGVAILGAMIGGVAAVSMNNQNNNHERKRKEDEK